MSEQQIERRNGDWLCTALGHQFWPLDPRPEEVHPEDIAHALSNMCRFGGHSLCFYSVAEHSVRVAVEIGRRGASVAVQLAGLLHDGSEAYMVDVPRPIKHDPRFSFYREAEDRLQNIVFDRFGISAEDRNDPIIKLIDNVILATEKRDLMPPTAAEWAPLPDPLAGHIQPWGQDRAKRSFLTRLKYLGAEI